MEELKESKLKKWTGIYRGVSFEIKNWLSEWDGKENWTYYLILYLNRIPAENKPNSYWLRGNKIRSWIHYNYNKHRVFNNIDFHGGITWYSKERGFDGDEKVIKIGCDYLHYWDENHHYYLETVYCDVKNTIDKFLKFVPNYKYWCCGNGKLYDLKDGILKNGKFISNEYTNKKEC